MPDIPLYWIPLLPLLGAAFNLLIGRKLPRGLVHLVSCGVVGASFLVVLANVAGPLWDAYSAWSSAGAEAAKSALHHEVVYTWIESGALKINLAFTLDTLSAVMVLTVTFVGFLIHVFSTGYMSDEPRYAAYFGYLNLFTGAMLILVLADSLPVMFIGWEGVGLCSYLLIGFWFDKEANANAGRKAFVVNRIGDFAFLLGIFLIWWFFGTLEFSGIREGAATAGAQSWLGGERVAFFIGLLLFIGACGKSAQIPLYVWLPDAMAGPTPVSALIHAATMVTAGVYMVARLSYLYAMSTTAMAIVAGIGALTALVAAVIAFAQTDFKKVLAYSTVSQLGFMFVGVGVGAYTAGIFHLVTHAFFKAGLFLSAGSVMHALHHAKDPGDIRYMGGLRKYMPLTHGAFLIYWLAICGIFPFSGFFSKDEILAGAFSAHGEGWASWYGYWLWGMLSVAAIGTAFYMSRLYFLVFWGECRADHHVKAHLHESPKSMTVPLLVLAGFTCVLGAIGLPHLTSVHLPTLLHDWLAPSTAQGVAGHTGDTATFALMGLALLGGLAGIFAARAMYKDGPSPTVDRLTAVGFGNRVLRTVRDKLYVDELYDAIIVRPFRGVSQFFFDVVDRFVIDLVFVNGSAYLVGLFGKFARWFQNGQVQRYLVAVVVGVAAIVYFASRSSADFAAKPAGDNSALFTADTGAGPAAKGAVVQWDFDGDGKVDSTDAQVRWDFGKPGAYRVTMWLTDGVFGRTGKVTRQVKVGAAPPAPPRPPPGDAPAEGGAQ